MGIIDIKWDDFLRDYGVSITSSAATITALIAMVLAQFFKDHRVAKVLLVSAAVLFGSTAIFANFYSQHQVVSARLAEEKRHSDEVKRLKGIRDQLGVFISEGLGLMNKCADASKLRPENEALDWISRIDRYVGDSLGASYVVRLRNPAGVPITGIAGDKEHNDLYRIIYAFNFRLDEFSRELAF